MIDTVEHWITNIQLLDVHVSLQIVWHIKNKWITDRIKLHQNDRTEIQYVLHRNVNSMIRPLTLFRIMCSGIIVRIERNDKQEYI